jgi:hypothetical protein
MRRIHLAVKLSLLHTLLYLSACGGGGSSTQTALDAACASSTDSLAVFADTTVAVGKSAGAAVFGCQSSPREVKWIQTSGATVTVYADRMQAMSFEPPAPGTFTFDVAVADPQGIVRTRSVSIQATAPTNTSNVTARVDQYVYGGSDVSLRAWPNLAAGDTQKSIFWQQIEGPAVNNFSASAADPLLAQFTARRILPATNI